MGIIEKAVKSKLKVINLFAGPGAGKSTIRAGLFHNMKRDNLNCEEVTEYAKDVTWDESQPVLSDQLFVLANQQRRLFRLQNKVEWAISDSPLLLSIHYVTPDYLPKTFRDLTFELWETYENVNFFVERCKPYNPIGRNQDEAEAREIDRKIRMMLDQHSIPYVPVKGDRDAADNIYRFMFPESDIE